MRERIFSNSRVTGTQDRRFGRIFNRPRNLPPSIVRRRVIKEKPLQRNNKVSRGRRKETFGGQVVVLVKKSAIV